MSESRVVTVACPNPKCPARMKVKTRQAEKVIACPQCGTNVVVSASPSERGPVSVPAPAVVDAKPAANSEYDRELVIAIGVALGALVLVVGIFLAALLIEVVAKIVVALLLLTFAGCSWGCIQAGTNALFGESAGESSKWIGECWTEAVAAVIALGLAFGLAWATGVLHEPW